ncbi:MAG: hypothetical protein V8Q32_01980 [Anaerotignum faecicola]
MQEFIHPLWFCWRFWLRFCRRWQGLGNSSLWFGRALVFLVVSCPCALVLSVPLTYFAGIGAASKCGILVKGGGDSGYAED